MGHLVHRLPSSPPKFFVWCYLSKPETWLQLCTPLAPWLQLNSLLEIRSKYNRCMEQDFPNFPIWMGCYTNFCVPFSFVTTAFRLGLDNDSIFTVGLSWMLSNTMFTDCPILFSILDRILCDLLRNSMSFLFSGDFLILNFHSENLFNYLKL